ncbi:MAG TPA: hypothetical protein VHH73_05550, partial [Verrucomicrobiae bacterium]|nr:hypothetical protein [Verrucomicrobiae bacterium]
LSAKMMFWSLLGVDLIAIGFLSPVTRWIWLLLLTLPMLVWWSHKEQRDLRRIIATFLDEVAAELKLVKMDSPPKS